MDIKEFEKTLEEKLINKKNKLIKTKNVLEKHDKALSVLTGAGAFTLYMSNMNEVNGGIIVQGVIGTVFVGCIVADTYMGSHILANSIENKLETGFEEDIDYELYKNENLENKDSFNKKALVRKLKK